MTFFGEYYFTNFGEYIFENLNKSLKLSQILVTKFLKISLIQQNFHQFWWKNMCKIINKYCHRFRWNFHHLITHYFLWFTKKITRIGENSAKNSSENQDGLLPPHLGSLFILTTSDLCPWWRGWAWWGGCECDNDADTWQMMMGVQPLCLGKNSYQLWHP